MKTITRDELKQRMEGGKNLAVIDVLGEEYFKKYHLPGAMNIPAGASDFDERIQEAVPDKNQPVVVYCMDEACPASPKAAKRLEELGYGEVYDYEAGKEDWKAAGLPVSNGR